MGVAAKVVGQTFKSVIYESVVGSIILETEILIDGSFSTTMWVQFPDGFSNEVFNINEACEALEI